MADADALRDDVAGVPASRPTPHLPRRRPDGSVMSLVDHLGELRDRLFRIDPRGRRRARRSGSTSRPDVRDFLLQPLPDGQAQVLGPGDAFVIQLRISIVIGIILAMPVLLYQVWAFVAPA